MDPYIGEIRMFSFTFAPTGWVTCDGKLYPIYDKKMKNLFEIIGFRYGGDGESKFAVPDMRGRVPVQYGESQIEQLKYEVGDTGGVTHVDLDAAANSKP
ncbi:phage tail protein [Azospirillum sp. B506]|uniref:phage tail protein n=1 Tax=Azospirillum sp. B506 TaxID=137721 RepID=UPI000A058E1C|nr:tail fiber protein [Azospirillum sp. B506]